MTVGYPQAYPSVDAWFGVPESWDNAIAVREGTPLPPAPTGDEYLRAVNQHRELSRMFERFAQYEDAARHRDRMHACKDRAINACCSLCDPRVESWHTTHEAATAWLYDHRMSIHGTRV